jgi:cytochrome c oxidase subunit III
MGTKHFSVATEAEPAIRTGGGGPRGFDPSAFGGDDHSRRWRVPNHTYQTGVWLFIGAITMMFAGLTSTVVVRQSAATDWTLIYRPWILYVNTLILLLSSVSFEYARRAGKAAIGTISISASTWLYITMGMGLLFVAGQLIAWKMLVAHGVYLATNPSSSTFYLLTAVHALHLLGGIGVLGYLVFRMSRMTSVKFRACLGAASLYWHFMSALWIYILLLLVTRT